MAILRLGPLPPQGETTRAQHLRSLKEAPGLPSLRVCQEPENPKGLQSSIQGALAAPACKGRARGPVLKLRFREARFYLGGGFVWVARERAHIEITKGVH